MSAFMLYVDVGTNGRNPDGHAWSRCSLKMALKNLDNLLNIPADEPLPVMLWLVTSSLATNGAHSLGACHTEGLHLGLLYE